MQGAADDARFFDATDCVTLVDTFGSDARIVNAARVSYAKQIAETHGQLRDSDKRLIFYLAEHGHSSPFFHALVCLRIKMPIFVAREWYRHTVGLARNEVSRRYVDGPVECFVPESVRARDPNKKQGSKSTFVEQNYECRVLMQKAMLDAMSAYRTLLRNEVAPEIARMVLPQSMMTEFVETGSLAAYARICQQRLSSDAQSEIRAYAERVDAVLSAKFPIAWRALMRRP